MILITVDGMRWLTVCHKWSWHSVTWPYTMTTPYWSDFVPNSTFNRNLSGFHRTFATGVACRQGTLTPPYTWSRPFGTCICSTCWDLSFSELVVILPDYALWISLGTFSILLYDFSSGVDPRKRKWFRSGLPTAAVINGIHNNDLKASEVNVFLLVSSPKVFHSNWF